MNLKFKNIYILLDFIIIGTNDSDNKIIKIYIIKTYRT